mgnify:CR=1 FL=1
MLYSATLKLPYGDSVTLTSIPMRKLVPIIDNQIKTHYHIDMKINNQKIYNLLSRPQFVSKFLKDNFTVKRLQ